MRARCPGARAIGPARLERLPFLRRHRRLGLGQPSRRQHRCMACCGGSRRATSRRCMPTNCCTQGSTTYAICRCARARGCVPAMIYLLRRRAQGKPKPGYVELIAAAARDWKLPERYVRSVERWSTSRWTGARVIDAGEHGDECHPPRGRAAAACRASASAPSSSTRRSGAASTAGCATAATARSRRCSPARPTAVAAMIEACRNGPLGARVDALYQREGTRTISKLRRPGEVFSVLPTA